MATGDLNLVPDDSVRALVPRYLTAIREFDRFEERGLDAFLSARSELARHVDFAGLRFATFEPAARDSLVAANEMFPFPSGPLRPSDPVDVEALVRGDEVHRILLEMQSAKAFMRTYRALMLELSEGLLTRVEPGRPAP